MQLTPNFSLAELTASRKAQELRLDNTPSAEVVHRLTATAELLERVRSALGNVRVTVTSGYRCAKLNAAVGGVTSSDHLTGQAADIVAPGFGSPYQVARKLMPLIAELGIGQLILEGIKGKRWVHVSTRMPQVAANRVITITDAGKQFGIQEVA